MTTLAAIAIVPDTLALLLIANGIARSIVGFVAEVVGAPRRRQMRPQQPGDQHAPFDWSVSEAGSVMQIHNGGE